MKKKVKEMDEYDLFVYDERGYHLCFKIAGSVMDPDNPYNSAKITTNTTANSLCVFNEQEEFEVIGNVADVFAEISEEILRRYRDGEL